ncbi:MAG TPA: DUF4276 family protein, partial [Bryobacteraceae bacterium]|nr:DUF4276 family protein [Bryobacteraceae bacterium]
IGMLVDSEDPLMDPENTWGHLKLRDNWDKPSGADDEQVMFMTTCMESWIVADRVALREHFGPRLQESALPPLFDLEGRNRHDVQDKLIHATRDCTNAYSKGSRSFKVLEKLTPTALSALPSFARMLRILMQKL